jgi:hypothetical protein
MAARREPVEAMALARSCRLAFARIVRDPDYREKSLAEAVL